jgi:hypothetical protein
MNVQEYQIMSKHNQPAKALKNPSKEKKEGTEQEMTLVRDLYISYPSYKTQVASVEIYCPGLREEQLRPVEPEISKILHFIMRELEKRCMKPA